MDEIRESLKHSTNKMSLLNVHNNLFHMFADIAVTSPLQFSLPDTLLEVSHDTPQTAAVRAD
jgi:hypothetical protein